MELEIHLQETPGSNRDTRQGKVQRAGPKSQDHQGGAPSQHDSNGLSSSGFQGCTESSGKCVDLSRRTASAEVPSRAEVDSHLREVLLVLPVGGQDLLHPATPDTGSSSLRPYRSQGSQSLRRAVSSPSDQRSGKRERERGMEQKTLWTKQLCEHLRAPHRGKPEGKGLGPPWRTEDKPRSRECALCQSEHWVLT